jgi:hypothetical protein
MNLFRLVLVAWGNSLRMGTGVNSGGDWGENKQFHQNRHYLSTRKGGVPTVHDHGDASDLVQ